jgi:sulfoxide reductase heme-binding subunit YedZ
MRGEANPPSSYLRRDVGIMAGTLAILHVVLGLQVHMGGDFVRYFFIRNHGHIESLRFDAFGLTNHLGLLATLIFLVLLAISSNAAMHKLGSKRWKSMQRWTYLAGLLVIVHGLIYQALEKQAAALVVAVLVTTLILASLQGLGVYLKGGAKAETTTPRRATGRSS